MTTPVTTGADERAEAQRVEYGQYVAKGPIFIGNGRAYNEGDSVPVSAVEGPDASVSRDDVERVASKTAAKTTVKES